MKEFVEIFGAVACVLAIGIAIAKLPDAIDLARSLLETLVDLVEEAAHKLRKRCRKAR